MPSHPHTASHICYTPCLTQGHTLQPPIVLGHRPSSAPSVPVTFWSLAHLPGLGLLRSTTGPVGTTQNQERPRTAAWPQANVPAPHTTPQPLLPAYSAITPTSVSHFPGAPSDKFIKLRDDTVNGHIKKKKEKEGRAGKKAQSLPWCCKETFPHFQGHQGGLGEASSFLTITCFLSEAPPVGPWYSSLQFPGAGLGVGERSASVRGYLVRQWLS